MNRRTRLSRLGCHRHPYRYLRPPLLRPVDCPRVRAGHPGRLGGDGAFIHRRVGRSGGDRLDAHLSGDRHQQPHSNRWPCSDRSRQERRLRRPGFRNLQMRRFRDQFDLYRVRCARHRNGGDFGWFRGSEHWTLGGRGIRGRLHSSGCGYRWKPVARRELHIERRPGHRCARRHAQHLLDDARRYAANDWVGLFATGTSNYQYLWIPSPTALPRAPAP